MAIPGNIISRIKSAFFSVGDIPIIGVGNEVTRGLHEGNAFVLSSLNTSLNSGGTHVLSFQTPDSDGSQIHAIPRVQVKGDALLQIYEGSTITQGSGSTKSVFNRKRDSSSACGIKDQSATPTGGKFSYDVSIASEGTLIYSDNIGLSGVGVDVSEFVLKSSTTYALRIISRAASNRVGLNLYIHQH